MLTALDAYRTADGGYGWGLEPDLRSTTGQPVAAMHALEVLAEVRDTKSPRAPELLDWLSGHTFPDGGVPFGLPYLDTAGSAGHWVTAHSTASSLMMTAQLEAQAHRLARYRADVAGHPWLGPATSRPSVVGCPHRRIPTSPRSESTARLGSQPACATRSGSKPVSAAAR